MISPNIGILVVLILVFLVISSSKISLNVGNQRVNITESLRGHEVNSNTTNSNAKKTGNGTGGGVIGILNQYKYLLIAMAVIGYVLFQISIEIGVLVIIVMLIKHKELSNGLNDLMDGNINRERNDNLQHHGQHEEYEYDYEDEHDGKMEHMIGGMHPEQNQRQPPSFIDRRFETNFADDPSNYTGTPEFEKRKRSIRPQYDDVKSSTVTHQPYDPSIPNPEPKPEEEEDKIDELFDNLEADGIGNKNEGFTAQDTRFTGSSINSGMGSNSMPVQSNLGNDNDKFTKDLRSGNFDYNPNMDMDLNTEEAFKSLSPNPNPSNIQMSISKMGQGSGPVSGQMGGQSGYDTDDDIDNLFRDLDNAM